MNKAAIRTSLQVNSALQQLRAAGQALRSLLEQAAISDATIGECELVLQELLTNIVDHAYAGEPSHSIGVDLQIEPGPASTRLIIRTEDTGAPTQFDLKSITMPDPESLQEGGYGMAIILALTDQVSYSREGSTNCWQLVKLISDPQGQ